jgi:hypothetical protein
VPRISQKVWIMVEIPHDMPICHSTMLDYNRMQCVDSSTPPFVNVIQVIDHGFSQIT